MKICEKCKTAKEEEITIAGEKLKVNRLCDCEFNKIKKEQAEEARRYFNRQLLEMQEDGLTDKSYKNCRFENADSGNVNILKNCQKYVSKFDEMRKDNIGIIFYGDVGTGKSFMASCIVNALIDKQITASVTNFQMIMRNIKDPDLIAKLNKYELLVIEDFGVENGNGYVLEQVYSVIDNRLRSGKPLIITTNLDIKSTIDFKEMAYKRIYDRILEMCPIHLPILGVSRRTGIANKKVEIAKKLLRSE